MHLPLEPQNASYYPFHFCFSTPKDVWAHLGVLWSYPLESPHVSRCESSAAFTACRTFTEFKKWPQMWAITARNCEHWIKMSCTAEWTAHCVYSEDEGYDIVGSRFLWTETETFRSPNQALASDRSIHTVTPIDVCPCLSSWQHSCNCSGTFVSIDNNFWTRIQE